MGRKKRPLYGVVATDSRNARDGRFIEDLGRYNPLSEPAEVALKEDRVLYWLGQGAQPSDTVRSILSKQGLMLAFQMTCKGAETEAIEEAVRAHRARHSEIARSAAKTTVRDRQSEALEAETKAAAAAEAEAAKARQLAEQKAKEAADAARKEAEAKVEAEREAATAAAKDEQVARNEEQTAADSAEEPAESADATEKPAES